MLPLFKKVQQLTQTKVTGLGLSVFRIFIALVLIAEVSKLFYFRHLYFDPIPYISESELSFSLILLAWIGVLVMGLLVGFMTRAAALINYVLVLVFFSSFTTLKYHFDAALIGISFMLILLPVSTRLSVDSLFHKLRVLDDKESQVRRIYYYLPVLLILCLQYFDSFFHKSVSSSWLSGLGVWLPASLPNQVYTNQSWLLNQKELIIGLGYLVLIFEFTFVILLIIKNMRPWLILFGIGMHLMIALVFPIPTFGITFAGIYMLLLPISFWTKLSSYEIANRDNPTLTVPTSNPLTYRVKLFIQHFDIAKRLNYRVSENGFTYILHGKEKNASGTEALKIAMQRTIILAPITLIIRFECVRVFCRSLFSQITSMTAREPDQGNRLKEKLIYLFILYLVAAQIIKTINSPLVSKLSHSIGLENVRNSMEIFLLPFAVINTKLLGITENLIYTGFTPTTYEILGIAYVAPDGSKVWLPVIQENGMASPMHFGRVSIGTKSSGDYKTLQNRLIKITSFWAQKHNISLCNAEFVILSKPVNVQLTWEIDFLNKQLRRPWQQVGKLIWSNNKPSLES